MDIPAPGRFWYLVWHREEGTWKIVSWHLENPIDKAKGPELLEATIVESGGARENAPDPAMVNATLHFLRTWLVTRDLAATLNTVAPEALPCAATPDAKKKLTLTEEQAAVSQWFTEVEKDIPNKATLGASIQRVDFSHTHMQEVSHPDPDAYLLVRVSDGLAAMSNCNFRVSGAKFAPGDTLAWSFVCTFKRLPIQSFSAATLHEWGPQVGCRSNLGAPAESLGRGVFRCPDLLS